MKHGDALVHRLTHIRHISMPNLQIKVIISLIPDGSFDHTKGIPLQFHFYSIC